jgi:folate-binding protein YgfZ
MVHRGSRQAYDAARQSAGLIDRSGLGRLVVSGADRASYLQGLLTNDIASLSAGQGCYAAYLTAQGRMIADLHVYELGDLMLLTMDRGVKDAVLAKLDQFVFTEDVKLGDVSDSFAQWAVVGPRAAATLAVVLDGVSMEQLQALADHGNVRASRAGTPIVVAATADTGVGGFDVFLDRAGSAALTAALEAAGAVAIDPATADVLRIEAGIPLFHRDMDEETIPLEAGIEKGAISFTKGCYVGQEVIIRVLHRGHGRVARRLVGLLGEDGSVPAAGAAIAVGDRTIGTVTSAALSPALGRPVALGYVQRDFLEPETVVSIDGHPARVVSLPFVTPSVR